MQRHFALCEHHAGGAFAGQHHKLGPQHLHVELAVGVHNEAAAVVGMDHRKLGFARQVHVAGRGLVGIEPEQPQRRMAVERHAAPVGQLHPLDLPIGGGVGFVADAVLEKPAARQQGQPHRSRRQPGTGRKPPPKHRRSRRGLRRYNGRDRRAVEAALVPVQPRREVGHVLRVGGFPLDERVVEQGQVPGIL